MSVLSKKNINNYCDIHGEDSKSDPESSSSDESTSDSEKNIESNKKSSPDVDLPLEELNIEDKSNSDSDSSPSEESCSNSDKKKDPIKNELFEILFILTKVLNTTNFDDNFYFINKGITYKLGHDSKIISKIFECILIENLKKILNSFKFKYLENDVQNKYPDFIIISKINNDKYYAIDIKSTYLKNSKNINGFTLGTFNGYFKERNSLKSIIKPYNTFIKHYCLCIIYKRDKEKIPVKHILLREKWQLASKSRGSGNTCNIGSTKSLDDLLNRNYFFKNKCDFDEYWLRYKG
jgi:hypothetical protein